MQKSTPTKQKNRQAAKQMFGKNLCMDDIREVAYYLEREHQAIEASIQIRRDGGKAALMRRIEGYPLFFYSTYAKRNALEKVVYFAADGNVQTVKPQRGISIE